ncbi:MAG: hypothetical protein ACREOH_02935 [Candidatus Entotheonellia bacterium]
MAWQQWIIPVVLLGGVGGLYYLMAKKGIGCCGSMTSGGCGMGMGDEERESPQPRAEAREPIRDGGGAPQTPAVPVRTRPTRPRVLVGMENGHPEER